MINETTFKEMLARWNPDFVLKVVQADVVLTKSQMQASDFDTGAFVLRLTRECVHNGLERKHFDTAVAIGQYETCQYLGGLGGSYPEFPYIVDER